MSEAKLNVAPCPRCGCHLSKAFDCFCGAVHDEYCANCCRWRSLPDDKHVMMTTFDVPCARGNVEHNHEGERVERIGDLLDKVKAMAPGDRARWIASQKAQVNA